MNGDMIHDDTERDRCGDASVRAYHALAQRYQYSVVHAMAPDLYWVRNDVLTSSVGLDAYDTTNDAEAHVKAGSHVALILNQQDACAFGKREAT